MPFLRNHNRNANSTSNNGVKCYNVLLFLNLIMLIVLIGRANNGGGDGTYNLDLILADKAENSVVNKEEPNPVSTWTRSTSERDFLSIAKQTGSDKVQANTFLQPCLDTGTCTRPGCVREKCRPWGHFYNTFYQRWLGPFSRNDAAPFQFIEIGYYKGQGFEAYTNFLPRGEGHTMEISCIESGPREEGKWPWGNFAEKHKWYVDLLNRKRLHCGDASDVNYLEKIWQEHMNRPDAPPLKLVIDDASHLAHHMVKTFFYWFPKIQPRGFLVIEDIQPIAEANKFRAEFLPQIMSDLHYCGDPKFPEDAFFPTLWPLLASISCEMHICLFERNDEPANLDLPLDKLQPPDYALDYQKAISATRKQ